MNVNFDRAAYAFSITFGPRRARIYTHSNVPVAEPFLARGLDVDVRVIDARAAELAEHRFPGRAGRWTFDGETDLCDRVAVLCDPFDGDAEAVAAVIAWLCRERPDDVLLVSSTDRSRDVAVLENAFVETGYELHPRAARLASALDATLPTARAYRYRTRASDAAGGSVLALRTEGARAALTRADLAAQFIRPGDLVFDEGVCGGASAVVLHAGSAARRTIGLVGDAQARDAFAVRYGRTGRLDFLVADDASAPSFERPDFIFHTAQSVVRDASHLEAVLAVFRARLAVLTPAGRLFMAIEFSRCVERAGLVADLLEHVRQGACIERVFCQNVASVPGDPGEIFEVAGGMRCEGDWLIVVAMTSPIAENAPPFVERAFAVPEDERFEVARFSAAYSHPWIIKGLVARGMRPDNRDLLREIAGDVQRASPPDSVDYAAALCVEAHQIEIDDADGVDAMRARITDWLDSSVEACPHQRRWTVSLLAVLSRLHLCRGDVDAALAACLRCASIDVVPFSPLLGAKTLEALHLAATIRLSRGEREAARAHLRDAVGEAKRLLSGDWINILGDSERPLVFGLPEASQLLAIATRSAVLLTRFDEIEERGGAVWSLMTDLSAQTFAPISNYTEPSVKGGIAAPNPPDGAVLSRGASAEGCQVRALADLADARGQAADAFAQLAAAKDQAADAFAQLASAKDQAAQTFAQLAEVRREAAAEVLGARGQATDAFAQLASAKDQAADAFAQLASAKGQAAEAFAQLASAKDQAADAFAQLASAKDQVAQTFAQLAETRREAAAEVLGARGQAADAFAQLASAKDQVAQTFAQLAEVRREAAAEVLGARGQAADAFAQLAATKDQAADAFAQLASAKDQVAQTFAQLAEVRREAVAEVLDARGQAAAAFAQLADVSRDRSLAIEAARNENLTALAEAERAFDVVRAELRAKNEELRLMSDALKDLNLRIADLQDNLGLRFLKRWWPFGQDRQARSRRSRQD